MSWLTSWRSPALLRRVIVNRKDDRDTAIEGVLWAARGSWLVLKHATWLEPPKEPKPIEGDVLVPRENVDFLEVVR